MIDTREQRQNIINTWTLSQSKERTVCGLLNENPVSPETVFFMALSNILAAEAGIGKFLDKGILTKDRFIYKNLVALTEKHRSELIEHGYLVS